MNYKRSPIFYMGNKYKLLKELIPLFPSECGTFIDLFGGSGCVSMNYQGKKKTIYNEFNENVVGLIKMVVDNEPKDLDAYWKSQIKKFDIKTMCDRKYFDNESDYQKHLSFQKGYYDLREYYNKSEQKDKRDLYLLICYSINHLIRFNSQSEFNVGCGNLQEYNENIYSQIKDLHNAFQKVLISNNNALDLKIEDLEEDTFIYCDPPYLNTEAVYNEKRAFGGWNIEHDYKLFELLEKANKKGIKWGLSNVYENRGVENNHLFEWCKKNQWQVQKLERNYNPFSRGNSDNYEVYISNYKKDTMVRQMSIFADKYLDNL